MEEKGLQVRNQGTGSGGGNMVKRVILLLFIVLLGVGAGLLFTPVFSVQQVECEGCSRMEQSQITEAAQVELNKNIFQVNLSQIKKNVAALPMVEEVTVRRVFPDRILIRIQECVPASYIMVGNMCAIVDLDGKVLEVMNDSRVETLMKTHLPPSSLKKAESGQDENEGELAGTHPTSSAAPTSSVAPTSSAAARATASATASSDDEEDEEDEEDEKNGADEESPGTQKADSTDDAQPPYALPLTTGIELSKYDAGKKAESEDSTKLDMLLKAFADLENAGLLTRATYLNVTDLSDVVLMIENRLEVQLGTLDNMTYRATFLAKIINEKISAYEHAVLDYRGQDVYVRSPEDGQARKEELKESKEPDSSTKPKASNVPTGTGTASAAERESGSTGSGSSGESTTLEDSEEEE